MVIVLRLPDEVHKRILCYPFIHALRKYYLTNLEEDEALDLHFITHKDGIECLYLLPFNAYYHELHDEDIESLFKIYRTTKNLKIETPVDLYINLNVSLFDALLGIGLGAKKRVGFDKGKESYFYTHKAHFTGALHFKELYLNFLTALEINPPFTSLISREIPPYYDDWSENPYMVINLDVNEQGEIFEDWIEFLSFFEKRKIVLCCDGLSIFDQKYKINTLLEKLPPHNNQFEAFELENFIKFSKLSCYAKLFVSYNSPLVYTNAYCGGESYLLNRGKNPQLDGPLGLLGDVRIFSDKDPTYCIGVRFDLGKIFDELDKLWPVNTDQE